MQSRNKAVTDVSQHPLMEMWQLVCTDGYERVDLMGDRQLTEKGGEWRYASPYTDEPTLLRRFAALDMTESSIISFADEYGFLGFEEIVGRDLFRRYEPIGKWRFSIAEVACAIALYETWCDDFLDTYDLEKLLTVETGIGAHETSYRLVFKHQRVELDRRFFPPEHIPRERARDYAFAAKFVFAALTADGLENGVSPKPKLSLTNELRLALEPSTLIAAIWLQVAQMAEQHKVFKRCRHCGAWLEVRGRESKAVGKKWCSLACKQAAYRQRKLEPDALNRPTV